MSGAGRSAIPPPSSGVRAEQAREKAGYAAVEAPVRATAERRVPVAPEAFARLAASMVPPPPPTWRRALARICRLWLLVAFVVIWELVSIFGQRVNPQLDVMMPPPTAVISAASDLMTRGVLFTHIFDSLYRVLLAVGAATALGVPLGLAMGWSSRFRFVVDPLLEFIRPIPPLAWIPLSILWFGIGDVQIVYIIFLAAFFPVVLNSLAGARDVDPYLVQAGLSLGARPRELFLTVVLPAALPHIFTGMRVGLNLSPQLGGQLTLFLTTIQEQGKLTAELRAKIESVLEKNELEDLYLPYKPKRRTKASIAREKGLEPLAQYLWDQKPGAQPLAEYAGAFSMDAK